MRDLLSIWGWGEGWASLAEFGWVFSSVLSSEEGSGWKHRRTTQCEACQRGGSRRAVGLKVLVARDSSGETSGAH